VAVGGEPATEPTPMDGDSLASSPTHTEKIRTLPD
jgi:hypothetical protein